MNSKPSTTTFNMSTRLPHVAGVLLALIMLLNLRRYIGINHDAALYLGQSLLERRPDIFGQDLFFAHGSQSSYTLFPWLISRLLEWAAPGIVFLAGTLVGLLAFAAASWYFLRPLLPNQQRYWAYLGVLCLPAAYGVQRIFSYAEPFFTSRPLAEACCLFSLGLLTRKRLVLGVFCAIVAGLLHPLQTLAAGLIAWPWLVQQDRRWLHAIWLTLPVALFAWLGIAPFSGLFQTFDPVWLSAVRGFTGQLFLSERHPIDSQVLGFDALVLLYTWRNLPKPFCEWSAAALAGLGLGLGSTLLLVDGMHLVLPTALQTWRVHWLAHLLAMAGVAALLYRDFKAGESGRALCLGLAFLLSQGVSWAWVPVALLYGSWPRVLGQGSSPTKRLLGMICMISILLLFAAYAANEWLPFRKAHFRLELYAFDRRMLIFPLFGLGLPLLGTWLWGRVGHRQRVLLFTGLLIPLLVLGAVRWDARPPRARAIESRSMQTNLFGVSLPEQAQVFWVSDQFPTVWLAMQRSEFFSIRQLTGTVFNRGTAIEANQRLDRVSLAIREDLYCQQLPQAHRERCQLDNEAMREACHPGPTRRPDYMVLPYRQPQRAVGRWDFIDRATGQTAITYWLYQCSQVMEDLGPQNTNSER